MLLLCVSFLKEILTSENRSYLLSTYLLAGDLWKTEKKTVRTINSIIVKKLWKWTKCSLVRVKPLGFLGAMTKEWHIKDWRANIYKICKSKACSFMKKFTHLKRYKGFGGICFFKKRSIKIIRLRKEIVLSLFQFFWLKHLHRFGYIELESVHGISSQSFFFYFRVEFFYIFMRFFLCCDLFRVAVTLTL